MMRPQSIYVRRQDVGSKETKKWVEVWVASDARAMKKNSGGRWTVSDEMRRKGKSAKGAVDVYGKELGRIEFERAGFSRRGNKLKFINRGVELSTRIMSLGYTTKTGDDNTAGGHGEVSFAYFDVLLYLRVATTLLYARV